MLVLSDVTQYKSLYAALTAAVTIGNFDGCHRGHRCLIDAVHRLAASHAVTVAMTFAPRPDAHFRSGAAEPLLFTDAQKSRALREAGLACQVVQRFDESFATQSHTDFYDRYLREALAAVALVVGYNFRFGRGREGDAAYLAQRARADRVRFEVGEAALHAGGAISSTRIRETLRATGDVAAAAAMLGRPYMLEGEIRRGDQLGRQLGVPTANLEAVDQLIPRFGVYAGWVQIATRAEPDAPPPLLGRPPGAIPAVFSLGIRPTLTSQGAPPVRIEAHLLAGHYGADEHYGLRAGYYLTHRLRDELRFDSLDELKGRMAADIDEAKRLLAAERP